ncbi:MAG: GWxTD domain-containing protein [Chryseolinea sp.]
MRYAPVFLLALITLPGFSQALRDINFSFQYDPAEPFTFTAKAVRTGTGWEVYYELVLQDSSQHTDQFVIQWENRGSLDERQGSALDQLSVEKIVTPKDIHGVVKLGSSLQVQYLTARILNNFAKRVWFFYKTLLPNYPSNGYLAQNGKPVLHSYIKNNTPVVLAGTGDQQYIVSFYQDDFPAAVPSFSEGMGRVARGMTVDTTYTAPINGTLSFSKQGLYLVQKDTVAKEGFAFRVQQDYPRLTRIESLADPLIYICTKQEFARVKEAKGDKKAFDKAILAITGSPGRAKDFIRNYYKRVEWANAYFTSYKEGWKTDRGMIYILYGLPDELFKFNDREVWTFNSSGTKTTFNFIKSQTLFDPENYVLIREKKFQELWYDKVDLWRNARF